MISAQGKRVGLSSITTPSRTLVFRVVAFLVCRGHHISYDGKPDYNGKGKGKFLPITGHEGPEGEQMYSSILPSTSALDGGGWSTPHPGRFIPRERPGTRCIGGWVGPSAGLYGCGKSCPTWIRSPDRPARSRSPYRLSYRGPWTPDYTAFKTSKTVRLVTIRLHMEMTSLR